LFANIRATLYRCVKATQEEWDGRMMDGVTMIKDYAGHKAGHFIIENYEDRKAVRKTIVENGNENLTEDQQHFKFQSLAKAVSSMTAKPTMTTSALLDKIQANKRTSMTELSDGSTDESDGEEQESGLADGAVFGAVMSSLLGGKYKPPKTPAAPAARAPGVAPAARVAGVATAA